MKFCINESGVLFKELVKLNNGNEDLARDAHSTINYLQDKELMSLKRMDVDGKMQYTIPMEKYTAEDIPGQLKGNYSKEKNTQAFIALEQILLEQDIDWIKVKETDKTYVITLEPNNIQDKLAKKQAEQDFLEGLGSGDINQFCNI